MLKEIIKMDLKKSFIIVSTILTFRCVLSLNTTQILQSSEDENIEPPWYSQDKEFIDSVEQDSKPEDFMNLFSNKSAGYDRSNKIALRPGGIKHQHVSDCHSSSPHNTYEMIETSSYRGSSLGPTRIPDTGLGHNLKHTHKSPQQIGIPEDTSIANHPEISLGLMRSALRLYYNLLYQKLVKKQVSPIDFVSNIIQLLNILNRLKNSNSFNQKQDFKQWMIMLYHKIMTGNFKPIVIIGRPIRLEEDDCSGKSWKVISKNGKVISFRPWNKNWCF